jgi:uncharacterized membrane protein YphA (DoxX/SURF4 family)
MDRFAPYATVPLRWGVGIVFLYFGSSKFLWSQREILQIIELGAPSTIAPVLNYGLGVVEVLVALAMLLGIYVRHASLVASALVVTILTVFTLKFGLLGLETVFRDIAILGATLSLALRCDDRFCIIKSPK